MKRLRLLILCGILTVGAFACVGCACGANMDDGTEAPYEDHADTDNTLDNGYDNMQNESDTGVNNDTDKNSMNGNTNETDTNNGNGTNNTNGRYIYGSRI